MKRFWLFLILTNSLPGFGFGQAEQYKPEIKSAVYFDITPHLSQMHLDRPTRQRKGNLEVINKVGRRDFGQTETNLFPFSEDSAWQKQAGTYVPNTSSTICNFDGITNISGYYPPDTQGDVGLDMYIQVVNSSFAIYSKTGTILFGPYLLSTIWAGIPAPWNGTNNGDPIVLYDHAANRWMISQVSLPYGGSGGNYAELIAISQTPDPTGAWYRYVFQFGNVLPDYPKFGVWPDAYYMSVNQFIDGTDWGGVGACAFDRSKMLAGDPTASMVWFNLGASGDPESMLPSDWDGGTAPIPGEPNHFTYLNGWTPGSADFLKIWDFHVDWINTANSSISEVNSLITSPFDSDICNSLRERCIPQPGTSIKLEALSDRLMYRLQYRNFGSYRTMVTNHTVDVDGAGHAGIRWYELRNSGNGWTIYQQGTYSPDALHRWVGSIALNSFGDIALGYSVSDATTNWPGIRYTGRKANDELGLMTFAEQTIINGTGSQTGSQARWGDYSMMSVDPADDRTFWYTTEYVQTTGSTSWKTRIASFILNNVPSVVTLPVSEITTSSATLKGQVAPNGLATHNYFEYGTSSSYGSQTAIDSIGSGNSLIPVASQLMALTTGITYHYRIVAQNGDGISYGNDITFIPGGVVITTNPPSVVTENLAILGGNISADGGSSVTLRGVCWSESYNPTITGNHTLNGSGTGVFTSNLNGLSPNTSYHARAYAVNDVGTYYGEEITFSTSCEYRTVPFLEEFSSDSTPICWSQVDLLGNGEGWQFGTLPLPPYPALTGNYAYLDSENYGPWSSQNADLVTPGIDLSGVASVNLSFNYYFWMYDGETGSVSYSLDNGFTWTVIQSFIATSTNPAGFSQSIPITAGSSQIKFKWNYTGSFGWYFAIDDILVTGLPGNRQLSNITLQPGSSNCYDAQQTISVAGSGTSFVVQNGGAASLIAGLKIRILPGATVQQGGHFGASIAPEGPFCFYSSNLPRITENLGDNDKDSAALTEEGIFRVYPNPTPGKFTVEIKVTANMYDKAEIMVYSMMGERVLSEILQGNRKAELSLSGQPDGIYLVQVLTGNLAATTKIIKQ